MLHPAQNQERCTVVFFKSTYDKEGLDLYTFIVMPIIFFGCASHIARKELLNIWVRRGSW